ncbi:MAG: acetylornithine carbamoyltransferase, partial [Bacteroidia bacterium]
DFVSVKNWSSYENYGQPYLQGDNWLLTEEKLSVSNEAKIMHCLPVRRNVELIDALLDGPNSLVLQQANNRVFAAQTILKNILEYHA